MKIDSAIRNFLERYGDDAISSIHDLANEISTVDRKITGFNIRESFDNFNQFLTGYAKYKVENANNPEASSQDAIIEKSNQFIDNIVATKEIPYKEIPGFVSGYLEGVTETLKTIDRIQSDMISAGISPDEIGDVSNMTERFMTNIDESFDISMNKILWASGYKSRQQLIAACRKGRSDPFSSSERPIFL